MKENLIKNMLATRTQPFGTSFTAQVNGIFVIAAVYDGCYCNSACELAVMNHVILFSSMQLES